MRMFLPLQFDCKFAQEDDIQPDGTFVRKGNIGVSDPNQAPRFAPGLTATVRERKIWLGPRRPPPESELDFVNEPQGWLIVCSRLKDPWFWKAHESEHYVECADTPELAAGTTGWCLTAPQAKFKLQVGFASGVGGEGWWVEICGCSLGFRDCSSFCSDMSSSQDEA
ncbi:hypothetical protein WN944_027612 [Citrus x changshan-huyou]|uniref:Uncharacterized protein n=1 Tax=Citrus x changshan-huyou TaxID=2935761 RepID=A0AAP0LIT8_9ROSI